MRITKPRAGLPIGAAAARAGINIETIRYYERVGVVPKPARAANGRRVYGEAEIERLAFVRRARELGFGLGEIRTLSRIAAGSAEACEDVRAMTEAHLREVRQKRRDLARLEHVLARLAAQCARGRPRPCPVIESLGGTRKT